MPPLCASREFPPGWREAPSRAVRPPPVSRTVELLVTAPMPLGVNWTCSEFRRYLQGLGHAPIPLVREICALLSAKGMHKYGVSQSTNATGARTFGTNPKMARRVMRSAPPPTPALSQLSSCETSPAYEPPRRTVKKKKRETKKASDEAEAFLRDSIARAENDALDFGDHYSDVGSPILPRADPNYLQSAYDAGYEAYRARARRGGDDDDGGDGGSFFAAPTPAPAPTLAAPAPTLAAPPPTLAAPPPTLAAVAVAARAGSERSECSEAEPPPVPDLGLARVEASLRAEEAEAAAREAAAREAAARGGGCSTRVRAATAAHGARGFARP